ncbi:FAD/NAD(P)-binding protein [Serratia ureilytica]|uniref:FAD/NAD(P)-binding protein n=1 Tax=Serratia TaxID=613 RepID=UPI0018D9A369|nr:FAD/NAD(P)-binding protein [Serratia ureilytica]MBH2924977.1 FAD/NAD(P)-binding protein [Serratia ureilytica]
MYKFGVIGGGAAGISFAYNFIKNKSVNHCKRPLSLTVFDKQGFKGGMAYSSDFDSHILNMTPENMSADIFDDAHFVDWIAMHFPQFCQDRYPPRWLYREYLDFIRDMTMYMAADSNVALNFVTAEVNAIAPHEAGYRLTTACGAAEQMNALVLCSGHNPPECLYPVDGVIAYQAHRDLPPIDAIVELMERLGATDICALSRSGLFPSVQPALMRPPPEAFVEGLRRFVAGNDFIDAHQLVHAINAALARHYPGPERLTVLSALGERRDCYRDLADSLDRARFAREHICSYLAAIHPTVCAAWVKMDANNRQVFMRFYNSSWMRNRHAMPIKNAYKIVAALESQRLRACGGLADISKGTGGFILRCHETRVHAQYLFNCTTPSYQLPPNRLSHQLLQDGVVQENLFGGVKCNPHTLKIADRRGREQHLYSLGAPAKGDLFYTSAMESITRDISKFVFNNPIFNAKKAEA